MYTFETVGERHLQGCMILEAVVGSTVCMLLNCILRRHYSDFMCVRKVSVCAVCDSWRETPTRLYDVRLCVCVYACVCELCVWRHYQTFLCVTSQTVYVYFWDSWRETPGCVMWGCVLGVCMSTVYEIPSSHQISSERLKKTFTNKDHCPNCVWLKIWLRAFSDTVSVLQWGYIFISGLGGCGEWWKDACRDAVCVDARMSVCE